LENSQELLILQRNLACQAFKKNRTEEQIDNGTLMEFEEEDEKTLDQ
jgi:hypothetical protein